MIRTDRIRRPIRPGAVILTCLLAACLAAPALAQSSQSQKTQATGKAASKPAASKPAAGKTSSKPDPKGKKPDPKASAAAPAGKPNLVATFGEWGVYAANSGKARTCYALGQPKDRQPASLKRDPGYVFISNRPGEGVRNEVSIIMGFEVKPDQDAKLEIGNQSFAMVAKGSNLWVKNAAEEGQVIDALKRGSRLLVKAASLRGNQSTDTYLLTGFGQALDRAGKECQ